MNPMLANEYCKHSAKAREIWDRDTVARSFMVQPKFDGVWCAVLPSGRVLSRTGKELLSLTPELIDAVRNPRLVMIGELVALGQDFAVSSGLARRKTPQPELTLRVFDSVCQERWFAGEDDETTYKDRLEEVQALLPDLAVASHDPGRFDSWAELVEYAECLVRAWGFDGAMAKDPMAYYRRRRSVDMELVKVKPLETDTLEILEVHAESKATKLGGWILVRTGKGTSRVGTGFNGALLQNFLESPEQFQGQFAEIAHMGVTEDGALREPRFLGFRDDA